jgi:type IV pilus assembly protein PilA
MTNELILNSNNIGVNTTRKSLTKKKKKGFTLVELIAVIAILAILAAIIVPRVANYTAKASNAKYLADAKTIANAVEAYNADKPSTPIAGTAKLSEIKTALMPATDADKYLSTFPQDNATAEFTAFGAVNGGSKGTSAETVLYSDLQKYIEANSK